MKPETKYVTVEVDGKPYSLPTDIPLLYALRDRGFDVPYFCSHPWLEPLGACRMCLVKMEAGGRMFPKLQIACASYAQEGMRVWLNDPEVLLARKEQLEFHLLNHPLECPVCDKGGECMLQDQTFAHGWEAGRFMEQKRIRPDKAMNDYVRLNYKRCIHCKRCVSFTEDIDQTHLLKFLTRGAETWIEGYPQEETAPRFSGNVIDMCPVGALTARSYRFMGRPWEQQLVPSIGSLDSVGANIWLSGRLGEVARIIPRDNPDVENGLIDDVTRFSWECIDDPDRLRKALVRVGTGLAPSVGQSTSAVHADAASRVPTEEKTNFAGGCKAAALRFKPILVEHGPDSIGIIAGNNLNTEEYLALRRLALEVLDTRYFHFGDEVGHGATPAVDSLAALTANAGSISQIVNASTVISIGPDLFEEAPSLGLWLDVKARRGRLKLINLRTHGSGADSGATYIPYIPGRLALAIEKELLPLLGDLGDDCALLCNVDTLGEAQGLRATLAGAGKPVYLNCVFAGANSTGALLVNQLEQFASASLPHGKAKPAAGSLGAVLQAVVDGKVKALLIVDADILNTHPDRSLVERALRTAETVIYCGPFAAPTSDYADVILPFGTWAHKEGTVVSLEWRVQKRLPGQIDSVAPTGLDLANQLASALGYNYLATELSELYVQLGEQIANWPLVPFARFPTAGVLMKPECRVDGEQSRSPRAVNAQTNPSGSGVDELRLIRKRFLYNDREEILHSPVFVPVWKPFCAFVNPVDAGQLRVGSGDVVALAGSARLELPVKLAPWVQTGTVVINDLQHAQPANALHGVDTVTLSVVARKADGEGAAVAQANAGKNVETVSINAGGGE